MENKVSPLRGEVTTAVELFGVSEPDGIED